MAILYGTTGDGTTLPVLVDQFGNLLAKGIEGEPGPPGPPGVGELPSGASDGALLGWQDGELVWVTGPLPPVLVSGFTPVIYTGNGGTQSIDCGFSPDLVWIKSRTEQWDHSLTDSVTGPNKRLSSNTTAKQVDDGSVLQSFDSDGFTIGGGYEVGKTGVDYVAWCWDAGDTTVTNNEGTIASQVRSNGHFSVVSYAGNGVQGATTGHLLEKAPAFIILKHINNNSNWAVYHQSLGAGQNIRLDEVSGSFSNSTFWGGVAPTSSVFSIGNDNDVNNASGTYVAYAWAETPGVSSFGDYSGLGSRQTIDTGFRPSLVIIKSTGSGNWFMFDNARGAANALYANLSSEEADTGAVEFLDDGFQLLFGLPGVNESNETYIYAAFANPSDAAFAQRQLRRQARQEERQQNETRPR